MTQVTGTSTALPRRWSAKFMAFLFPLETDKWLAALRIGLGLQVAVYALFLRSDWHYLFSSTGKGLVSRALGEAITSFDSPLIPKLGWLVALGSYVHIDEAAVLAIAWASLLCMGLLLFAGLFSRPAAIIAWFLHLCATESGGLFAYGADNFITTGLFYLMLSPLPDRYSLDYRLLKAQPRRAQLLGFWRRVLQVHLCFVYFIGGLAKSLGSGWWDGTNLWRSLTRPPFNLVSPDILIRFKYALPILGVSICLIELGYPFFIWIRKTRLFWLVCILVIHAAIGLAMGLYLFALVMIVLNVAAFGVGITDGRSVSDQISMGAGTGRRRRTSSHLVQGTSPLRGQVQPTRNRTSRIVRLPKRCFSFRKISDLEICSSS